MRCQALLIVCLLGTAGAAGAQPWREAYSRQDYAKAAELLHQAVLELPAPTPEEMHEPDPDAAELLAGLYADGLGVRRDSTLACAFLTHAGISAAIRRGHEHPTAVRLGGASSAYCSTLTLEARHEARQMVGCYVFDAPSETFHLGPTRFVETTRHGLRVVTPDGPTDVEVGPTFCHRELVLTRYVPVLAPAPGGPPATRHFFEQFHWWSSHREGRPIRVLTWTLAEVAGSDVRMHEHEDLFETDRPVWPPRQFPISLPEAVFTAAPDGAVTWRFGPSPRRTGTVGPLLPGPR